jgi:hypothetical protein
MANADYSWPNSPRAESGRAVTVVDTSPPDNFSAWPNRNRPNVSSSGWPIPKTPQRRLQKPVPRGNPAAASVQRPRPVGRWLIAFSLWAFAAGLFAAPTLSSYGDRWAVATLPWLASRSPAFLRPYLPKPIEAARPLPKHATVVRTVPAASPVPELPAKRAKLHPARAAHGKRAGVVSTPVEAGDPFDVHPRDPGR